MLDNVRAFVEFYNKAHRDSDGRFDNTPGMGHYKGVKKRFRDDYKGPNPGHPTKMKQTPQQKWIAENVKTRAASK